MADKLSKWKKLKTRRKTSKLIREGVLRPRPCEVCGDKKVTAHHTDYLCPGKITWFCCRHHEKVHGFKKGTIVQPLKARARP